MTIRWESAGATDVGRVRRGNEDTFLVDHTRGIFLVADGMGGHAAGEVASAVAAKAVADTLTTAVDGGHGPDEVSEAIRTAFERAWREIERCCHDDPRKAGMGTTLTLCVVSHDGWCRFGHIGDSRAYLLRDGRLQHVTSDHTWVQREIDAGRLEADAAESHPLSHILTRVLSADLAPEPDVVAVQARPGDLFLLSSDGLHGLVTDPQILQAADGAGPLPEILSSLIDAANRNGGRDNITAVAVRILPA